MENEPSDVDSREGDFDNDDEVKDPDFEPDSNEFQSPSQSLCGESVNKKKSKAEKSSEEKSKAKKICYNKKMEKTWTADEALKLIEEIEQRRTLWYVSSAEYKLPKEPVWMEVSENVNATVNDCKAK